MKILTTILSILVLLAGACPVAGQTIPDDAWTNVTVLLVDGWRYRDVTVYLDEFGAGMWLLRGDGAERLVPAGRVMQIVGPDGDDITAIVMSGQSPPGGAPPPVQQPGWAGKPTTEGWDEAIVPAAQQASDPELEIRPFKLAFTLEGGYGFPMSGRYEAYEPSWSAGARLRIGTSHRSYLGLGYRYQDLGTRNRYANTYDSNLDIYEGSFGWMNGAPGNRPRSYFELGAAFIQRKVSFTTDEDMYRYSQNEGAFLVRGGVLIPFGEGFGLDLGCSWTYKALIFTDEHEPTSSLLSLHLGLTWMN